MKLIFHPENIQINRTNYYESEGKQRLHQPLPVRRVFMPLIPF
ncbi:hypothetical protein CSB69_2148 [Morganella morganii]|nr:hypothetical protein CSB69_2148 [Morganella morganii]